MATHLARAGVAMLACVAVASASAAHARLPNLGPSTHANKSALKGYYDGHKDTYLITDVSNKAQAKEMRINFAPTLARVKGAPDQYFIMGRAAPGQLSVFDSEPGESTYNPLWEEKVVTWKPGVTPVVLKSDTQITALAKKHRLTVHDMHIVLNAPITHIGGM